jgi:SNF2 family DNA or RNA helicase|eukprot:COSAG01_NODE_1099_length_11701_cov_8.251508_9_plen_85_part_00
MRLKIDSAAADIADEWSVDGGPQLLVVVPKSLKRQWAEEIEQLYPQLPIESIHIMRSTVSGNEPISEPRTRLVITSFRLLSMVR